MKSKIKIQTRVSIVCNDNTKILGFIQAESKTSYSIRGSKGNKVGIFEILKSDIATIEVV